MEFAGRVEETDEGINAYNTEDALKHDVNPINPVHPSVFGSDTNKFDLNSSRTLREKSNGEFNFNTPLTRIPRNEFDHNKENNIVFSADSKEISPGSMERQTLALQNTIMQATNIDETTGRTNHDADLSKNSKGFQSLEIESDKVASGTENRRAKRRNKANKKNAS